jgi:hypothetical protein
MGAGIELDNSNAEAWGRVRAANTILLCLGMSDEDSGSF